LSDTNATRFERASALIDDAGGEPAETVQDFRKILDDPAVDAVVVATNHHWHGLTMILACQAGKDVYVEKPGCHNVWEGRKMVEAARKYDRVVQVGMQNRSAPYLREARDYIRSGKLGDIYLMRVLNMNKGRARPRGKEGPPPSTVDWDMWCGPGPLTAYSPGAWHINQFDYSVGYSADDAVHQIDVLRFLTDIDVPKTAVSGGGVRHFKDGRNIPDTQVATLEYDDKTLVFQSTLWANYIKETPSVIREGDQFPDWLFNGTKCEIFGSDGMMLAGRHGGGYQAFDAEGKLVAQSYGRRYAAQHMDNFLSCVRSREKPNAEIEEALKSTLVAHLGNVSYRVGGRMLRYDHATGWIQGDDEANQYMQRKGRAPWVIPENV
jgi:predicted dehydrogenase